MAQAAPLILSLMLLFGYAMVVALVLYGLTVRQLSLRRGGVAVTPVVVAAILLAVLGARLGGPTLDLVARLTRGGLAVGAWRLSPVAGAMLVIGACVAAVVAVYLAAHALPHAVTRWQAARSPERHVLVAEVVRLALTAVLAVAVVGVAITAEGVVARGHQPTEGAVMAAAHSLPGAPTGLFLSDGEGYVTMGEGQVARIRLSADGSTLEFEQVVDGLTYPRGPLVVEGRLLVVDLGPLACETPFPQCWTGEPALELERLEASAGRVLSFPIEPEGQLGEPDVVVTGLPVVNSEHAPATLNLGPDGWVYLTIGNVDRLPREPALLDEIQHAGREILGTLVRFRPDGSDLEVVTSGLRNVYDIVFDGDGRALGVDNDGETARGWRSEMLLHLRPGEDYGYPARGSFGPGSPPALWLLSATGTAGIAWWDGGPTPGVLVGALGEILFVPLHADEDGLYVAARQEVTELVGALEGYVTALARIGTNRFVAAIFDPSGAGNRLLILEITP